MERWAARWGGSEEPRRRRTGAGALSDDFHTGIIFSNRVIQIAIGRTGDAFTPPDGQRSGG
ncbi:MAG: hypothetical protein ACRDIX_00760 [Actinomycetota bacterium]